MFASPEVDCTSCLCLEEDSVGDELCNAAKIGDLNFLMAAKDRIEHASETLRFDQIMEWAAIGGHQSALMFIRSCGKMGESAPIISHVAGHGRLDIMTIMMSWGCDEEYLYWEGLYNAAGAGQISAMKLVNMWMHHRDAVVPRNYTCALSSAAESGSVQARDLLIEWGANYDEAISLAEGQCVEEEQYDENDTVYNRRMQERYKRGLARLKKWKANAERRAHHTELMPIVIALRPLRMHAYQELWILQYAVPGALNALVQVRLIERVNDAIADSDLRRLTRKK
jgi:hypothetical protein